MKRKLLSILALLSLTVTSAWAASGDILVVDANGGGQYTSISAAVADATGGETIFIKNGQYNESQPVSIGKSLSIVGESRENVIISGGSNGVFTNPTDDITLAIMLKNLTIKDVTCTGSFAPVRFYYADIALDIIDCTFDNCGSKTGAMSIATTTANIEGCTILNSQGTVGGSGAASAIAFTNGGTYSMKNCVIDGADGLDKNNYGAVYFTATSGTLDIESLTIVNCKGAHQSLIRGANGSKITIKNSVIANNNTNRFNEYNQNALFFVGKSNGELNIEQTIIANNTFEDQFVRELGTSDSEIVINYCNISDNSSYTHNQATSNYDVEANWWGSNTLPDGVTATTWVVEDNGNYVLNTGEALAKDIPGLTGGNEPQPVTYDVYVSPDGTGDGSSYETPTADLVQAMADVPDGGSIFFLNGEYDIEYGYVIYKNVALVGESRDGVIIEFGGNGYGFMTYNIYNMDEDLDLDFISISGMTLADNNSDPFFQVCSSVKEVNITDCVFNTDQQCLFFVGTTMMNELSSSFAGTFNFKNNVLSSDEDPAFVIAGNYDANINNNIFINGNSGAGLIEMDSYGECNVDYNYWGSNTPATQLTYTDFIIATASANPTEIYNDESAAITVAMTLSDGTSTAKDYLPDYPIEATLTAAGSLSAKSVTLQEGAGVVTYSNNVAGDDNIQVGILGQTLTVPITVKERYLGTIYVATTGNDDNDGSENAPVASVGKAVELALVNGGSGQIIINEGTYIGNGYRITGDLTVTGKGKVTLDANNEGRLFYMNYGDVANKIELSNLILTNAKGYGAAVYSNANELILDNDTIVNTQADGYLIKSQGKLTVKDSQISNSKSGDVIQQTGAGDILIKNSVFKDNVATDGSSVYAVINLNSGNGNLEVNNSKFINNKVKQGVIRGYSSYNIKVDTCVFACDTCTWGGGAIYAYVHGCTLDVTDSKFINNTSGRDGGAIYIGWRTEANIDKSVFINNSTTGTGYYGDAIYNANILTISNSVLLGNGSKYIIYNIGDAATAQNNWWGTNDNPKDLVASGYDDYEEEDYPAVDVRNWATMDASFAPADAQAGDDVTVTATFSNANLPDSISVTFTSTSGNLNSVVYTKNVQASTTYTIDAADEAIVATSTNAVVEMPIVTNIVTQANFSNFFDAEGNLLDAVPFDELIFQGEFSNLVETTIIPDGITLTGDNAVLYNMALQITGKDVTVTGLTLNENGADFANNYGAAIYVSSSDVTLDSVSVTYNAPKEVEAKAIFADGADNFKLINSEIVFTGADPGSYYYRGLEVSDCDAAKIDNNTITAELPAVPVFYSGNGIDQDFVLAVGIQGGEKVEFTNNIVNVNTNGAVSTFSVIDAVMIHSTDDILIKGNNITHLDTTTEETEDSPRYYYSLDIYNTTGTVEANDIIVNTTADVDRAGTAYPIQLSGPFTVTVKDNNLTGISKGPVVGINATNWSDRPADLTVENNIIDVTGYITTDYYYVLVAGIEAEIDVLQAYNNTITVANGADYDDANQVYGISMASSYFSDEPTADIRGNNMTVDGKYAVYYAEAKNANVIGNYLISADKKGDAAVCIADGSGNTVKDNLRVVKEVIKDNLLDGYIVYLGEDDDNPSPLPLPSDADLVELTYSRTLAAPDGAEGSSDTQIDGEPADLFTVCLPFAPKTGDAVKYYTLSDVSGETIIFDEVANPEANTPYLIAVFGTGSFTESCNNLEVTTLTINSTDVAGYTFNGTFTGMTNEDAQGKYVLQAGNEWGKVVAEENSEAFIPPFRAFIEGPANGSRQLSGNLDGSATGIKYIRTNNIDGTERYFDLNGRRIEKPTTKGIYIHNGRKEVLK